MMVRADKDSLVVDRMNSDDYHASVVALGRAFHHDPLLDFLVPDLLSQARATLTFLGSVVADGRPLDEVWVARAGSVVAGAAVWLPPGTYPRGARREAVSVIRDLRSVCRLGTRAISGMKIYATIDKAHREVREPHWYLALLGCDPLWQGRGVGTALLEPVLDRADKEGTCAYLETQKVENIAWYGRRGFKVVKELEVPGCPTMWAMLREPR